MLSFGLSQREEMNLPSSQGEVRFLQDLKATKTVGITITTFVLCYIPTILFETVMFKEKSIQENRWFSLIALYSLNLSNTVNPIIYCLLYSNRKLLLRSQAVPERPFWIK